MAIAQRSPKGVELADVLFKNGAGRQVTATTKPLLFLYLRRLLTDPYKARSESLVTSKHVLVVLCVRYRSSALVHSRFSRHGWQDAMLKNAGKHSREETISALLHVAAAVI